MTSSAGRTWFSHTPPGPQSCSHYQGIRVPLTHMRRNACTFGDFNETHEDAARRQLLHMFLRINYRMMRTPRTASGSRAYIEWDSEDEHSIPSYFAIHVIYDPKDPGVECTAEGIVALTALAAEDAKLLFKPSVNQSELMLRPDMWAALCATYTNGKGEADAYAMAAPADVFTADRAGAHYSTGVFTPTNTMVGMAATDLNPRLFFMKYCPWYQQRQLPQYPLTCTTGSAAGLMHMSRMIPVLPGEELRSAWELLKDRARRRLASGEEGYAKWAQEEIRHTLHGEQAGYVPKSERALNTYNAQSMPLVPYSDPELTPFAMWVAKFLMDCEAYAFLYKQHVLLLKLLMGTMDVVREAGNGQIHYSAILAGPNSTSKSYVFTLLEELLIPDTVSRATRRTENTFTYNRDQGARVLIDHEMSADFFGDSGSRKDASARTAQTKEVLTSHEATTESCQIEEGQRVMVESKSRAHICYLAATNDWSVGQTSRGESCKDSALVSRFDVIFPTRGGTIMGKSIMALMAADRNPSAVEKKGKADLAEWVRGLQQGNYWVHRSIHIGAIQDVNMDAAHAVIELYSEHHAMSPRTIERIIIMARQCCIITAIMVHYGFAGSPRKGETIQPQHVNEIEPLLVVTAEQTKFALGLYESELCSSIRVPFARALGELSYRSDPDLGFNYLKVVGCETATQLVDEVLMHMPTGHDVSKDLITAHMNKLRDQTINSRPFVPSVDGRHGMAEDRSHAVQQYYCMRGLSFHVKCVETDVNADIPLEASLAKHCHVGPKGREITACCVEGHAHLLQTRHIAEDMAAYTQHGMFMPRVSELMMGKGSASALDLPHRRQSSKLVQYPLETSALQERGAPDLQDFAQRCAEHSGAHAVYPDAYASAYNDADAGQKRKAR